MDISFYIKDAVKFEQYLSNLYKILYQIIKYK